MSQQREYYHHEVIGQKVRRCLMKELNEKPCHANMKQFYEIPKEEKIKCEKTVQEIVGAS